ncbi:unnamed protein product [Protopolystoma xenopodis]|uniref:Uncharacterized protein n=1 Tax=Protopolystoma xenopodis TaxID=117903 RepID=A0A448WBG6_9PLAT|nr:unnamed protein product [Protopolystoma xenopodis]
MEQVTSQTTKQSTNCLTKSPTVNRPTEPSAKELSYRQCNSSHNASNIPTFHLSASTSPKLGNKSTCLHYGQDAAPQACITRPNHALTGPTAMRQAIKTAHTLRRVHSCTLNHNHNHNPRACNINLCLYPNLTAGRIGPTRAKGANRTHPNETGENHPGKLVLQNHTHAKTSRLWAHTSAELGAQTGRSLCA